MEKIEIELPEELMSLLAKIAEEKGVSVDELIERLLRQKLRGEHDG